VPGPILQAALRAMGQPEAYRLFASPLVADSSALASVNWMPVTTSEAGLAALMRDDGVRR